MQRREQLLGLHGALPSTMPALDKLLLNRNQVLSARDLAVGVFEIVNLFLGRMPLRLANAYERGRFQQVEVGRHRSAAVPEVIRHQIGLRLPLELPANDIWAGVSDLQATTLSREAVNLAKARARRLVG